MRNFALITSFILGIFNQLNGQQIQFANIYDNLGTKYVWASSFLELMDSSFILVGQYEQPLTIIPSLFE